MKMETVFVGRVHTIVEIEEVNKIKGVGIMQKFDQIIKVFDKIFIPGFWDCAKPVTVSNAENAEGIIKDVKKASMPKVNFDEKYAKLKNLKADDFKITQATIPNYILLCTGVGVLSEGAAFVLKVPWYMPVVMFVGMIGIFVMKFQELGKEQEDYY